MRVIILVLISLLAVCNQAEAQGYPNSPYGGTSATAGALAADPVACPANQFVEDLAADGTLTCDAIVVADLPDAFILNSADDNMNGILTANGLILAQDENIQLGAETIDHDGTDFVASDTFHVTSAGTGDLLVAESSTGASSLVVKSSATTAAAALFFRQGADTGFSIQNPASQDRLDIQEEGVDTHFTMLAGGNFGLGQTNPTNKLTLVGAGTSEVAVLGIDPSGTGAFIWGSSTVATNMTAGQNVVHFFGQAETTKNAAYMGFNYASTGSDDNFLTMGFYAADNLVNLTADGNFGIGDTNPDSALEVLSTTGPQLRVTHTDDVDDFTVSVDSDGHATLAATGDLIIGNGAGEVHVKMDGSPAADETWAGVEVTGTNGGEAIAAWQVVYMDGTEAEWMIADADAAGKFPGIAITTEICANTSVCEVMTHGIIRDDTWNWSDEGVLLYLSDTAGGLTETAPSAQGDCVQVMAIALTADRILFNPSLEYAEVN